MILERKTPNLPLPPTPEEQVRRLSKLLLEVEAERDDAKARLAVYETYLGPKVLEQIMQNCARVSLGG